MYPISYNSFKKFPKYSNLPEYEIKRKYFLLSTQGRLSECQLFPNFVDCDYVDISTYKSFYDGTSIEISGSVDLTAYDVRYMLIGTTDGGGLGSLPSYGGNSSSITITYDLLGIYGAGWYIYYFSAVQYYSLESVTSPELVTTWTTDQGIGPDPIITLGPTAVPNGTRILISRTSDPQQYEWDTHGGEIAIKTSLGWDYENHPLGTIIRDSRYLIGGSLYEYHLEYKGYYRLTSNLSNTIHAIYWLQGIDQLDPGPPSFGFLSLGDTQQTTITFFSSCREVRLQYSSDINANNSDSAIWIDTEYMYLESQWATLNQFGYQGSELIVDFPTSGPDAAHWIRMKYTVKGVLQGYSSPGPPTA